MASINIHIDDELKARAYQELEKLGVTPSQLICQVLLRISVNVTAHFANNVTGASTQLRGV